MQAGIFFRQLPFLIQLKNIISMQQWVVPEEMKRKQEQRRDFFHTGMNSDNGIRKIKDLNCGIYLTGKKIRGNIFVFFRSATGLKWTSGNMLIWKKLNYLNCILLIRDYALQETVQYWLTLNF